MDNSYACISMLDTGWAGGPGEYLNIFHENYMIRRGRGPGQNAKTFDENPRTKGAWPKKNLFYID